MKDELEKCRTAADSLTPNGLDDLEAAPIIAGESVAVWLAAPADSVTAAKIAVAGSDAAKSIGA